MKWLLALFALAVPLLAQLTTVSEAAFPSSTGGLWSGTIDIEAAPACRLIRGGQAFGNMKKRLCVGVTGSGCTTTSAAGVISVDLLPTTSGTTPTGCYYNWRFAPASGTTINETMTIPASGPVGIDDIRATINVAPSATIGLGQLAQGGASSAQCLIWSGSAWSPGACASGGTGLSSLNGLTGSTQTFATGSTGTDFNIASSGTAHTFHFPSASALNRGLLTAAKYSDFDGKQAALGYTPLAPANNLSDVSSAATARTNLALGNVDNTSDATKNAATATLTNKTITTPIIGSYTVAGLPAAGTAGRVASVTDAATAGSCTSGGGSNVAFCRDSGASWVALGDGGAGGGSGTVTDVSVVSANGIAGTVATSTSTPAITLTTTVTGVLKGNGTAISAASAGTDYVVPAGNVATATALAANGTNCSAGSFPLGVDASGNSETCTALPTTISGTANQITASAATGAVTLSIPTNPTLPGTTTGTFSGNLTGDITGNVSGSSGSTTGNATTATALAANGTNCSGSLPRGVDASGNAEGCADVDLTSEITGALPDGNLSSNVPLKNGSNTFTGVNDFQGATSTAPNKSGTAPPGTCSVGQTFFDTDATAGQNMLGCTATNTWTVQGTGAGVYIETFTSQTTVTITAAAHGLGANKGDVTVYDGSHVLIDAGVNWGATGTVVVTFATSTTGTIVLIGGSAGSSITAADVNLTPVAFASLPSAATAGRLQYFTDAPFVARDTGSAWAYWCGTIPCTPAGLTTFGTAVNAGSSTITNAGGVHSIDGAATASASYAAWYKSIPSAPYTVVVKLQMMLEKAAYPTCAVSLRESGSGKVVAVNFQGDSTSSYTTEIGKLNSPTSFSANYTISPKPGFGFETVWVKINDNNTNRIISLSTNGLTWIQVHSVTRTDWITPDQIGIGWDSGSSNKKGFCVFESYKES